MTITNTNAHLYTSVSPQPQDNHINLKTLLNRWKSTQLYQNLAATAVKDILSAFQKESDTLDLSGLELTSLPPETGNLKNLTTIELQHNNLSTLPTELANLQNLKHLDFSFNPLSTLLTEIGNLQKLTHLYISGNPLLSNLPISLGTIPGLTHLSIKGTKIPQARANQILESCQAHRNAEALKQLPAKIQLWKGFADIQKKKWPTLTGSNVELQNLHEWLVRLSRTSDFGKYQTELANTVCPILETLHKDKSYLTRFSNLVAGDLTECGDRGAMSLNLVYADWKLYALPQNASLKAQIDIIIAYGRTLKFREYMTTLIGDEAEGVEIMLYAETKLQEKLSLLSTIKGMKHDTIGNRSWLNLDEIEATIKAITPEECIYELEYWHMFLRKHSKKQMSALDDKYTTLASEIAPTHTAADKLKVLNGKKEKEIKTLTKKVLSALI